MPVRKAPEEYTIKMTAKGWALRPLANEASPHTYEHLLSIVDGLVVHNENNLAYHVQEQRQCEATRLILQQVKQGVQDWYKRQCEKKR